MADIPELRAELAANGARLHPDGTITVFHRTTADAAAEIRRTGRMTGEENGLFFSTRGDDAAQAAGHGPVAVELRLPLPWLELDDAFGDEAHLRWPLAQPRVRVHVGPYLVAGAPAPRCITVHANNNEEPG